MFITARGERFHLKGSEFLSRHRGSLKVSDQIPSIAPVKILIATHHKVGTALLYNIFIELDRSIGLRFHNCSTDGLPSNLEEVDVLYDWHSKFRGIELNSISDLRGVHLIRDPRMIVVSAAYYHQRSSEAWLHRPLERLGGLTYQQRILSLAGDKERFEFEMSESKFTESAGKTIRDRHNWCKKSYSWCKDIRLEDLMTDEELSHYRALFWHLHLKNSKLANALSVAYNNSVFNPRYRNPHVRSRKVEDWRMYYDADLSEKFRNLFERVVEDLGYTW